MVISPEFWHGRSVFVTGHTGFKGSWLALWLAHLGARVAGYALSSPTTPSLFELSGIAQRITSIEADVRDLTLLHTAMRDAQPEIVLHLAAQSLVRPSYQEPVETYSTNVMGTVNLLEAVRRCPSVRAAIIVTSDKCYENKEWLWGYREDEPMGGHDPYSSSKGCAELVTTAYRSSFLSAPGAPGLASVRAGNVIGGGDWARDRLIPDILQAFAERRPVLIRSPHAVRPWQHVLEPLGGYLLLAEKLFHEPAAYAGAWNFGPGDDDVRPVSWIVERLRDHWGGDATWQVEEAPRPHEAAYLKLDCSKAHARLGWWPTIKLEQALEQIVAWHRAYLIGEHMGSVTQTQIADYWPGQK
jgi:CDP-glucose 4,6-dehydratase